MKKTLVLLLVLNGLISSQWLYNGNFPSSNFIVGTVGCHGLTTDPLGRVWIQYFQSPQEIHCYNTDGTPASFSPITSITVNGKTTLLDTTDGRGLATNHEGNILIATKRDIFVVNYLTGSGIAAVSPFNNNNSPTAPAVDEGGNIYLANVLSGYTLKEFDSGLNFIRDLTSSVGIIGRTSAVSEDGLVYWLPRFAGRELEYSGGSIHRYSRPDKSSGFIFKDSVFVGLVVESMTWHPVTGQLWVSSGSNWNLPDTNLYSPNVWYAIDIETNTIVDSILWQLNYPLNPEERPRAITFSLDGNTAYVGCFGGGPVAYPPVQKFVRNGAQSRTVSIPNTSASPGETVLLPIQISDMSAIAGASIRLVFDESVLEALNVISSSLTGNFQIADTISPGQISLAMAGDNGLMGGSGTFVNVRFRVKSTVQPGQQSPIMLESVALYDENTYLISATIQNGIFTVDSLSAIPKDEFLIYPNPFTPGIVDGYNDAVNFVIPDSVAGNIAIIIYTLSSRKFKEISDSGSRILQWDGLSEDGELGKPGVYIYLILVDGKPRQNGTITLMQ